MTFDDVSNYKYDMRQEEMKIRNVVQFLCFKVMTINLQVPFLYFLKTF